MNTESFTHDEESLLLYLECCATDHAGLVELKRMNTDDHAILARWALTGFVNYGRVTIHDLAKSGNRTNWVRLSDEAVIAAHALRIARANRMWANRRWRTGEERLDGVEERK